MNWGLRKMIILCTILGLGFFISVTIFSSSFMNLLKKDKINSSQIDKSRTYNSMEVEVVTASKKYVKNYYKEENIKGETLYVPISSLQNTKLLHKLYDVKDSHIACTGYVEVYDDALETRYKPYMKCGKNYEASGYIEKLDN